MARFDLLCGTAACPRGDIAYLFTLLSTEQLTCRKPERSPAGLWR